MQEVSDGMEEKVTGCWMRCCEEMAEWRDGGRRVLVGLKVGVKWDGVRVREEGRVGEGRQTVSSSTGAPCVVTRPGI